MSLKSTVIHALGIVAGILIPGASSSTASLTHSVQQHLADLYGTAARDLAAKLSVDTTGMSGPDKVFAITKALIATAQRDGFKGDVRVLGAVLLDVAQAAWRASEPEIETGIVALASSLTSNPLAKVAETLVVAEVAAAVAPVAQAA